MSASKVSIPVASAGTGLVGCYIIFSRSLCTFSGSARFVVHTSSALAPGATSPARVARFGDSPSYRPGMTNGGLCFPSRRKSFSAVHRCCAIRSVSRVGGTRSVASRVPGCVRSNICSVVASATRGILFYLAGGTASAVCLCGCLFTGRRHVRSS